jgi:dipeptidyl aminopeptidase/acylaminoacyl peptidase
MGEVGLLPVFPYYGPWCWMNRQARNYVDELVESIYREYKIPNDALMVSLGDSMGGLAALLFTRYARRPVARCCAIYPVCDLPYHYTERIDVPRTVRMAYWGYPEPFDDVLIEHSPLHQVSRMPKVPYLFLHGELDNQVNKQKHSDRMVAEMQKLSYDVVYHGIPAYGHGGPMPPAMEQAKMKFVLGT